METIYPSRFITIPEIYPEHEVYWSANAKKKLLMKYCSSCENYHYYPRTFCPFCHQEQTVWREVKGTGTIYTYSVMRIGTPYAIAFVELDEGIRMMTNIVDCDFENLYIGQKVKVIFKQSGNKDNLGPYIPCFTPIIKEYSIP